MTHAVEFDSPGQIRNEVKVGNEISDAARLFEENAVQKVRVRILPFVLLLFVVAFLDRINIGFAALTMNKELGITSEQYGLIAGIFFVSYFIFEIPSNLLLHRIGARIWIARILITWGIVATLTGFVHNVTQLYVARFLLGLAEAGYLPGIILYLTYWFQQRDQARSISLFLTGAPIASILGAPISGLILDQVHWLGMSSWRWLLVLEGIPAIVCGFLAYFLLPNSPSEARFLTAAEKAAIQEGLSREEQMKLDQHQYSVVQAMTHGRVWLLASIHFGMLIGFYTLNFWVPQLMKSLAAAYSNSAIGLLVVIPSLAGLVAMVLVSRSSDRKLERRYHIAIPAVLGGTALALLGTTTSAVLSLILLSLLAIGVYSYLGPFWTLPSTFLSGYSAAAGIALINSLGSFAGFVGPSVVGYFSQRAGSLQSALPLASVPLFAAAILVVMLPKEARRRAKVSEMESEGNR